MRTTKIKFKRDLSKTQNINLTPKQASFMQAILNGTREDMIFHKGGLRLRVSLGGAARQRLRLIAATASSDQVLDRIQAASTETLEGSEDQLKTDVESLATRVAVLEKKVNKRKSTQLMFA